MLVVLLVWGSGVPLRGELESMWRNDGDGDRDGEARQGVAFISQRQEAAMLQHRDTWPLQQEKHLACSTGCSTGEKSQSLLTMHHNTPLRDSLSIASGNRHVRGSGLGRGYMLVRVRSLRGR